MSETWNSCNYPGTLQLCSNCEEPTGRCERNAMRITWANCAEKMPPDDEVVIVKSWTGSMLKINNYALGMSTSLYGAENYSWTEYTKEIWEYLNETHTK